MSYLKFVAYLFLHSGPRYSWRKVLLVLVLSSFTVVTVAYLFYRYERRLQKSREARIIQAIVQTGPHYNRLSSTYLSEAMGLSVDHPTRFNRFNLNETQKHLLATSVIKKVQLKKIKPNIVYIAYTARQPIANLGDWTNTAIDEEGFFFPSTPFYSPKRLTEIYLGELAPMSPWGKQISREHMDIIKQLFVLFENRSLKRMDLSQVEETSLGKRQIVILLEKDKGKKRLLRLTPKNYVQELAHYFTLEAKMLTNNSDSLVIDLRVPHVAYLQNL